MSKITFANGDVAQFEIYFEFSGKNQAYINKHIEIKNKYIETVTALKTLMELSEGARTATEPLIKFYENKISIVKGLITNRKKFPVKTRVSLTVGDKTITAFSSISREDRYFGMHSRKVGRVTAINNLLAELAKEGMGKAQRTELAKKLLGV